MIAQLAEPIRWVPGILHRLRSDSLVRNSLYIMTSTVVTAGLGYLFWIIVARAFTRQDVGIGGAVISLCSTVALLTYLGPQAMLIESLPERECMCVATAGVTAVVTAIAIPLLLASKDYRIFFNSASPLLITLAGAAIWTLVNLFNSTFIAARRAGRFLSIQTVVSAAKVLFVIPLAAVGAGSAGVVGAWVASAFVGVVAGIAWLIPGMGLGRSPDHGPRRHAAPTVPEKRPEPRRIGSHRRRSAWLSAAYVRRLLGQHLTSLGGSMAPLVMPVLVVIRLGVTLNAYFYITWMMLLYSQSLGGNRPICRRCPPALRPAPRRRQGPARDRRDPGSGDACHDRRREVCPRPIRDVVCHRRIRIACLASDLSTAGRGV